MGAIKTFDWTCYSYRKATDGLIRAARRAGIEAESAAIAISNADTARYAEGSVAFTPNSIPCITRVSASAPPTTMPGCAERDSHADLTRTARHRKRNDSIDADSGEQQREQQGGQARRPHSVSTTNVWMVINV